MPDSAPTPPPRCVRGSSWVRDDLNGYATPPLHISKKAPVIEIDDRIVNQPDRVRVAIFFDGKLRGNGASKPTGAPDRDCFAPVALWSRGFFDVHESLLSG